MSSKKHELPDKRFEELDIIDKYIIAKKVGVVPSEVSFEKFLNYGIELIQGYAN